MWITGEQIFQGKRLVVIRGLQGDPLPITETLHRQGQSRGIYSLDSRVLPRFLYYMHDVLAFSHTLRI